MNFRIVAVAALLASAVACQAQTPVQPSPDLSPEDVVSIQLKALSGSENNDKTENGIKRVWAFAHPANRVITGPLARFTQMLKSPAYRPLIGHRAHHLKQVSITSDKAHFAIKITGGDGTLYGYSWHLGKVGSGNYQGTWMTTNVVLVGKLGQSL